MIKNLQEKLHQVNLNNRKVQTFVPILNGNLLMKNAPKLSSKYLGDKMSKFKQI